MSDHPSNSDPRIQAIMRRPDLTDSIQDACIARMEELGLNPNRVAELLDGKISRAHVCDFLTRRASIGSHKLQHLLDTLGLEVIDKK